MTNSRRLRRLVDRFFETAHIRGIPARRTDVYSVGQGFVERGFWIMAAPRRVVELAFSDEEAAELARLARSRTEPASRVERARMLLAYRQTPSFYAVGRDIGVTHQTVERCMRRAERLGDR